MFLPFFMKRSTNRMTREEEAAEGDMGREVAGADEKDLAQSISSSVSEQTFSTCWLVPLILVRSRIASGSCPPDSPRGRRGWVSGAIPRSTEVVGVKITYP